MKSNCINQTENIKKLIKQKQKKDNEMKFELFNEQLIKKLNLYDVPLPKSDGLYSNYSSDQNYSKYNKINIANCSLCGKNGSEIHHVNKSSKLVILCSTCHQQDHNGKIELIFDKMDNIINNDMDKIDKAIDIIIKSQNNHIEENPSEYTFSIEI